MSRTPEAANDNDGELTVELLRNVLSYNADTGKFRWLVSRGKRKAGDVAGKHACNGYWRIKLFGKEYPAHRLAWFFFYGEWPDGQVDHINLDKIDNRIVNLRQATVSENQHNKHHQNNNTSGFKGVSKFKRTGRWRSEIMVDGHKHYLGSFATAEEAADAYAGAAMRLHAEFARDSMGRLPANDNHGTKDIAA